MSGVFDTDVAVLAATEVPYRRRVESGVGTGDLLAQAVIDAVERAGFSLDDVDGLAVSSFTHAPDRAVDLAWSLGLRTRWFMDDGCGGVSGFNTLQHAWRALQAGDADLIVLVAGDVFQADDFSRLVDHYNQTTRNWLRPLEYGGPNGVFAMLTTRQMQRYGLQRADYGRLAVAQREWAMLNPGAVYRTPLSLETYLDAPMVADPLGLYDCVPVVSGANALVLARTDRARGRHARIAGFAARHNPDGQQGDGLATGLRQVAGELWRQSGIGPGDIQLAAIYDDYPAMVLAQLDDLGFIADGDYAGFIQRELATRRFPVNTSGGQLSAGQAGTAGGMHGIVEVARHLMGEADERQVPQARYGLASGYGMVEYRYGMCAAAVILEAGGGS
ncbi:MAG: thiolase family protein [Pigmentiphaga sp.]|nr:thiolase family protein [Pigmentiphaga sp.]